MKQIFEEAALGNLKLNNRLIRSATWEGIADNDGSITEDSYEIYEELAQGGIGAIITGFTSVAANDHYFGGMMRLSSDSLIPQYKKLTDIIHKYDCPVITQLALGAFYHEKNGQYIQTEADEMTSDEIKHVISLFVDAASRAKQAGFDGVQIHAAHFFFLSRFISTAVNHRMDEYGGSTENRVRILLDIINGIRKNVPGIHITIKINSNDFTYNGIDEDECLQICKILDKEGIDSIEVSGNGTSVGGIKAHINEGYFVPAAARIASVVRCPVIAVGGFRSVDTMESVLKKTEISFISLSRPLLREPDLPEKMRKDPQTVSKCVSCNACYSSKAHKCIFRGRNMA